MCQHEFSHYQYRAIVLKKLLQIECLAIPLACSYLIWLFLLNSKKMDDFKHALGLSADVYRQITDNVIRKSSTNRIIAPPNWLWLLRKSCIVRSDASKVFCVPSCIHPKRSIYFGHRRIVAKINDIKNVFPVPPGKSKKKIPPVPSFTTFMSVS